MGTLLHRMESAIEILLDVRNTLLMEDAQNVWNPLWAMEELVLYKDVKEQEHKDVSHALSHSNYQQEDVY